MIKRQFFRFKYRYFFTFFIYYFRNRNYKIFVLYNEINPFNFEENILPFINNSNNSSAIFSLEFIYDSGDDIYNLLKVKIK